MNLFFGKQTPFQPEIISDEYNSNPLPEFRHFTAEERIVANKVISVSTNGQWSTRYPFVWNGQPQNATRRRLYTKAFRTCRDCGKRCAPWIDRYRLIAGTHCEGCHKDALIGSYLEYELRRTSKRSIVSDFEGYISDDPAVNNDLPMWAEDTMTHLGAAMGTGKTTLIFNKTYESEEYNAITVILVPRKSLALAIWSEQRRNPKNEHGYDGWGLFYGGSEKNIRKVGRYGVIGTISSLPVILQQMIKENVHDQPVYIFVDEIDFATSLIHADILKSTSIKVKDLLRSIINQNGIVVAGQTEMAITLESAAAELDIDPDNNLYSYYNRAPEVNATAEIRMYTQEIGMKNKAIAGMRQEIDKDLIDGLNVYAHCDGRRVAQLIAKLRNDSLLYDRYNRSDQRNEDLLYLRQLTDTQLFASSNAVDVGISLHDEKGATHVGMIENPLAYGNIASAVQKGLRNRSKQKIMMHYIKYNNPLPLAPDSAIHKSKIHENLKLDEGENLPYHLITLKAKQQALETLATDQPETFIAEHWNKAGYQTALTNAININESEVDKVKTLRKDIKDKEKEEVIEIALDIIDNFEIKTDTEIRNLGEKGRLTPIPTKQLAHELANQALQAAGWDDDVERWIEGTEINDSIVFDHIDDEQWECAKMFITCGCEYGEMKSQRNGYIGVHYNDITHESLQIEKLKGEVDITHIEDDRMRAGLLVELLDNLPQTPTPLEDMASAIIHCFQSRYGNQRFSGLIKDGSLGLNWSTHARFVMLGSDATPNETHIDLAQKFMRRYYPAYIAKADTDYMLILTHRAPILFQIFECYIKYTYHDIPQKTNTELTPTHNAMPNIDEELIETAKTMKENGATLRQIAETVDKSIGWTQKHTAGIQRPNIKAQAKEMVEKGLTVRQISDKLDKDRKTIARWIKENPKEA